MKSLKMRVICMAYYDSELLVPDELSHEEAQNFAESHMEDIPVTDIHWIGDTEIEEDMLYFSEEENGGTENV